MSAAVGILWILAAFLAGRYHDDKSLRALNRAERGRTELADGRTSTAVAHFREAVSLDPARTAYRFDLAQGLITLGQSTEAEAYLRDILQQDAMNGPANRALARIHGALGREAEAEAAYYRAIYGLWPSDGQAERVETRLELIDVLRRTADRDRVRAELAQLALAFPGDLPLQLRVGHSLLELGFVDDAARQFDEVGRRFADPQGADAGRAEAELQRGDYVAAFDAARRAVVRDPNDSASAARRDLSAAAMALDPALPRLSVRQRTARTRQLLARARTRLETCWSGRVLSDEDTSLLDALEALAAGRPTRSTTDDPEDEILESAARRVLSDCSAEPADRALDLVLRRLVGETGR